MHGRLISFTGADPARREEAIETIRAHAESVISAILSAGGGSGSGGAPDHNGGRPKAE